MITTLTFKIMLLLGIIVPMEEQYQERDMYTVYLSDGGIIEHAYKEEVFRYIKTDEFLYEEDCPE